MVTLAYRGIIHGKCEDIRHTIQDEGVYAQRERDRRAPLPEQQRTTDYAINVWNLKDILWQSNKEKFYY